ncbi:MFS transporter [Enteractinococcus fodinae]|uniref:MFS family permease n=1 Tax=Enteractinococcus fodinae TaxID=684663 RepID=A0ABU2B2Z4_9MICC|nr:MFS transporter [Enteractinococcus fodinae]MDR7347967.1 MFS family permease [Enteractinococcus fodinae]
MTDRPRGGLAALCIAQVASWGLLYYSLPVAVPRIADDTGWSHTTITAALTIGLLVSAVAGLRVGKLLDATGPRRLMTGGSLAGVLALLLVAWSPNVFWFYVAWLVAGLAQSAVLYPPAFAVITRWYGPQRVSPLTILALVGGLASTIFAPIVAYLIEQFGWRTSYVIMAIILGVITVPLHMVFLNGQWSDAPDAKASPQDRVENTSAVRAITRSPRFILLTTVMSLAAFALFAVTINIVPLVMERGMAYSTAAIALGLLGAGQVVGRLGYGTLSRKTTPRQRTILIYGAGAISLAALAVVPEPAWLIISLAVCAGAARGCHTLLQATAASDRWGTKNFAQINATLNAPITALSALAPVTGPALAAAFGSYTLMGMTMAGLLVLVTVASAKT